MKKSKKKIFVVYLFLTIMLPLLFLSCGNWLEWANPKMSGSDAGGMVERGDQLFDEGDFDEAMTVYSNAMLIEPESAKARLGYARCIFWNFLPDFAAVFTEKYLESTNTGFSYDILIDTFNDPLAKEAILATENQVFYDMIIETLDSPYGIVNGMGDQEVSYESLEVNLLLLIAYACEVSLNIFDSDRDGDYCEDGDYIIIKPDGQIGMYKEVDEMMSNLTEAFNLGESNSIEETLITLSNGHVETEEMLGLVKFIDLEFTNIDKIIETAIRPKKYLEALDTNLLGSDFTGLDSGNYENLYESMEDAYSNSNSVSSFSLYVLKLRVLQGMSGEMGDMLNTFHSVCVGEDAYVGSVQNFVPSAWDTHDGGLKKIVEDMGDLTNMLGETNIESILSNLTNNITMEEIEDMIVQYGELFGFTMDDLSNEMTNTN